MRPWTGLEFLMSPAHSQARRPGVQAWRRAAVQRLPRMRQHRGRRWRHRTRRPRNRKYRSGVLETRISRRKQRRRSGRPISEPEDLDTGGSSGSFVSGSGVSGSQPGTALEGDLGLGRDAPVSATAVTGQVVRRGCQSTLGETCHSATKRAAHEASGGHYAGSSKWTRPCGQPPGPAADSLLDVMNRVWASLLRPSGLHVFMHVPCAWYC